VTREEHLLVILMEECAEVAHRASKILRFGMDEVQPGQQLSNRQRLFGELIDLMAVADMLAILPVEDSEATVEDMRAKIEKVEHFLLLSQAQGTLDPEDE
jgi:hypothetical protein